MAIRCGICGHESPDGSNFCEGCGVQLAGQSVSTPPSVQPQPEPQFAPVSPVVPPQNSGSYQKTVDQSSLGAVPATNPLAEVSATVVTGPMNAAPQAPALPAGALVIKRYGAITQEQIPLLGERLVVGRFDPSSGPVDIDLTGLPGAEHISRRHAEIFAEGGAWKVRDLGSSNGIYLKRAGEGSYQPRLQEVAELHDGDEIAFGNTQFVFRGV